MQKNDQKLLNFIDNKKKFYIDGKWQDPRSNQEIKIINPATEENTAVITLGNKHDVDHAVSSAKKAYEQNIFIHTLGMGLAKGGPIPIYNKNGSTSEFRKDRDGNIIITKLNETVLKDIAQTGNGTYIRANNSKSGLSVLFEEINKMDKKEIGTMVFTNYKDRFQIFIAICF